MSSINKTDSGRRSPLKSSKLNRQSPRDYNNPFILDTSTTGTDDSTLPSLMLSSEESTENMNEKAMSGASNKVTMDIGVNTDNNSNDNQIDNINNNPRPDKEIDMKRNRPARLRNDNFTQHLWSHKCPLPCVYEMRTSTSPSWSYSSHSDTTPDIGHDDDVEDDEEQNNTTHRESDSKSNNRSDISSNKYSGKMVDSSRKCASNVFVQTEYSGEIKVGLKPSQKDSKMSPICSSDSTIKDTDQTLQCCSCGLSNNLKTKKQTKHHRKLKKSLILRSLESKFPEETEALDNEASIMDKTSFIPPKSWYSLGSLCDEDENCKTCGHNSKHDAHRNYHMRMYDSDTKLNLSGDAVSYNDTGYTSTEEDNSSSNSADLKGGSSCDQQSSPENGSYDGDYESDDEIFQVRLVGSDDMVYKPLPSISEPFGIQAYATKEWAGDTPKARAIREVRNLLFNV